MIVLDNSVVSAFHRLRVLPLLSQLYGTVVIPDGVRDEFSKKWTSSNLPAWLHVENLKNLQKEWVKLARQRKLGKGEAQSIILAQKEETLLAIDEQKARGVAKDNNIPVIGSAGILRMAYEYCPIAQKKTLTMLLRKLKKDLYLQEPLIQWVLQAKKR